AIASPTDKPRWRPWLVSYEAKVTGREYWDFVEKLVQRMLVWSQGIPSRVLSLLPLYDDLWRENPKLASEFISKLAAEPIESWSDVDKAAFTDAAKELVDRHREHPEAKWAIPSEALTPIEAIL